LPAIVVVKLTCFVDHYVVVLEVGEGCLIIGDPLGGRQRWTAAEFEERWRRALIYLKSNGK